MTGKYINVEKNVDMQKFIFELPDHVLSESVDQNYLYCYYQDKAPQH